MITREIANHTIPNREFRTIGVFAGVLLGIYVLKMFLAFLCSIGDIL